MAEELGVAARRGIKRHERSQLVSILQRLHENLSEMESAGGPS